MYSTWGREPSVPAPSAGARLSPGLSGTHHCSVISSSPRTHDTTLTLCSRRKRIRKAAEMVSNLPLPIPPRTPTPPSDDATGQDATQLSIDRDSLTPLKDTFPRSASLESGSRDRLSPTNASFNLGSRSADPATPAQNGSSDSTPAGPFNFNTTVMAKGPVVKSVRSMESLLY